MSLIYIADAEGHQLSFEEQEAHRLWREGAISSDSLCWREGMADWRPVTEIFGGQTIPDASAPGVSSQFARGFVRDPTVLTKTVIVLLWIYLCISGVSALLSTVSLATGQAGRTDFEELSALDILGLVLALPQLLVVIVTAVIFLMWIYRANLNARGLGAQGMKFTPGWSVGWFFIPIANLWKPYQAMKEIWQASANPHAWRAQTAPSLLNIWWTLWIVSNVVSNLSIRLTLFAETRGAMIASEVITLFTELIDIPLCLVAMRLVREIIRHQTRWAGSAVESCCAICNQPLEPSEMIYINQTSVCARCKPVLLQQIQEGVAGQ